MEVPVGEIQRKDLLLHPVRVWIELWSASNDEGADDYFRAEQQYYIQRSTSSYIDDILVNVPKVSSENVITHLRSYGLVAKPAEKLEGGTALGLRLSGDPAGRLWFGRGGEPLSVDYRLTKQVTK